MTKSEPGKFVRQAADVLKSGVPVGRLHVHCRLQRRHDANCRDSFRRKRFQRRQNPRQVRPEIRADFERNFRRLNLPSSLLESGKLVVELLVLRFDLVQTERVKYLLRTAPENYDDLDAANDEAATRTTETFALDYSALRNFCRANNISASALTVGTFTNQQESLFSTIYHGLIKTTAEICGKPCLEENLDANSTGFLRVLRKCSARTHDQNFRPRS